jgi:hypothetical protein
MSKKFCLNITNIKDMKTNKNNIPADALISRSFKTGMLYPSTSSPNFIILFILYSFFCSYVLRIDIRASYIKALSFLIAYNGWQLSCSIDNFQGVVNRRRRVTAIPLCGIASFYSLLISLSNLHCTSVLHEFYSEHIYI